jgi:hypothetical protein
MTGLNGLAATAGTWCGDEGHAGHNGRCAFDWGHRLDAEWEIVAYRLAQPGHVTRMIAERDELADRMAKLKTFMESNKQYFSLAAEDQVLLHEQHDAMGEYLAVLNKRIDRL